MNFLDKYQNKILIGIWTLIFLTCLFVIFTEPVKAATSQNELPFEFDKVDNYNDWINQDIIDSIEDYGLPIYDDDYVLNVLDFAFYGNEGNYIIYRGWFSLVPIDTFGSSNENQDFYNTSLSYTKVSGLNSYYFGVHFDIKGGFTPIVFNVNSNYSDLGSLFGHSPTSITILNTPFVFTSYVPAYFNKNFYSNNDNLVLELTPVPLPDGITGHATGPINDPDNLIKDGDGNPIIFRPNKPTPTPFTPQPFNPPSIDTSTLETLVESLIDVVEYGFNYIGGVISGVFSNLLSNFGAWVDYIVESFNFGFNNVVKAIQNLATDFYNNMVSLFEPLYDFFNGVATFFNSLIQLGLVDGSFSLSTFFYNLLVPDPEDFAQTLLDSDIHHVVPLVQAVKSKFVSLFDSFYNLTPTKVFLIPSFTWHGQTFNLSIDFSWYDDYKVYGDTIITGFLIIGYIYWFVLQLNSMFRGGNSIGHDVSKVGGKE